MMSAAAALGLVMLWDVDDGLAQVPPVPLRWMLVGRGPEGTPARHAPVDSPQYHTALPTCSILRPIRRA